MSRSFPIPFQTFAPFGIRGAEGLLANLSMICCLPGIQLFKSPHWDRVETHLASFQVLEATRGRSWWQKFPQLWVSKFKQRPVENITNCPRNSVDPTPEFIVFQSSWPPPATSASSWVNPPIALLGSVLGCLDHSSPICWAEEGPAFQL